MEITEEEEEEEEGVVCRLGPVLVLFWFLFSVWACFLDSEFL